MALDPLHQFIVWPIFPLRWAGWDVSFTIASCMMVLSAVLTVGILGWWSRDRKVEHIPSKAQALGEMVYVFVEDLFAETVGKTSTFLFSFVFSLFLFILTGNMLGMLPYGFTFTSHIVATFTLAMFVFTVVTIVGFVYHGLGFLRLFLPEGTPLFMAPLVIPIELISYLSRPISLSVRLFANMMAGHTMMKVFSGFAVLMGIGGVAPLMMNGFLTVFEVLVAFLQAYVFTILTCLYLQDAIHLH